MIIDAMDLLYSNHIDAFALMTSDSDFTPLVLRILESGLSVYGFGEKKTPKAFVDACSLFIYTEKLLPGNGKQKEKKNAPAKKDSKGLVADTKLVLYKNREPPALLGRHPKFDNSGNLIATPKREPPSSTQRRSYERRAKYKSQEVGV